MICVFRLVTLAIVSGLFSFSPFAGTYHQESFWEVKARACGDRERDSLNKKEQSLTS
jgi:hypothetical protein